MAKKKKDINYFMFILAGLLLAFLIGVFVASSGEQQVTGAAIADNPEVIVNACQADGTSQMFMLEGDKYQVCQVYSCGSEK